MVKRGMYNNYRAWYYGWYKCDICKQWIDWKKEDYSFIRGTSRYLGNYKGSEIFSHGDDKRIHVDCFKKLNSLNKEQTPQPPTMNCRRCGHLKVYHFDLGRENFPTCAIEGCECQEKFES